MQDRCHPWQNGTLGPDGGLMAPTVHTDVVILSTAKKCKTANRESPATDTQSALHGVRAVCQ